MRQTDVTERQGATYSFYLAHTEVEALQAKANQLGISRNEAARQAIREFTDHDLPVTSRQ
jgi:hypothetical protein